MPEYLAPGVYVEETSFRSKSIEGVSTTTTGFVGPCRYGPTDGDPTLVTSLGEFAQTFGDGLPLEFAAGAKTTNYLWHAARAFFEEGGKRLYVSRVYVPKDGGDGRAFKLLPDATDAGQVLAVRARHPGEAGKLVVRVSLEVGQSVVSRSGDANLYSPALQDRDVVWISKVVPAPAAGEDPPAKPLDTGRLYLVSRDATTAAVKFDADPSTALAADEIAGPALEKLREVRVVRLSLTVGLPGGATARYAGLSPDPRHQTGGRRDSLFDQFDSTGGSGLIVALAKPDAAANLTGLDVVKALFPRDGATDRVPGLPANDNTSAVKLPATGNVLGTFQFALADGGDGLLPTLAAYTGAENPDLPASGLRAFEAVEDISIVAAPGHTAAAFDPAVRESVTRLLIAHAERMRYRIAVLDGPEGAKLSDIRRYRAKLDSTYAALYYPWVTILDPVTQAKIDLPPSGFVSGIYARNDSNFAVYKAPANEPVRLALGFAETVNQGRQEVLNPEGINCFRFFEGRGNLLWGARTITSDSEWKYVSLRRYFAYLERSIDRGSQFAVFMPNGERLWDNVRRAVSQFLLAEWQSGALLGDRPEKAFFVRCDRTTMTQNDLDNGRLVCLVGVAPVRPAEFVIFRVGQWTGDSR